MEDLKDWYIENSDSIEELNMRIVVLNDNLFENIPYDIEEYVKGFKNDRISKIKRKIYLFLVELDIF